MKIAFEISFRTFTNFTSRYVATANNNSTCFTMCAFTQTGGHGCFITSRFVLQLSMNPFYRHDTPIKSESFDTRVRAIARRYL
jgi:hypothetical protein